MFEAILDGANTFIKETSKGRYHTRDEARSVAIDHLSKYIDACYETWEELLESPVKDHMSIEELTQHVRKIIKNLSEPKSFEQIERLVPEQHRSGVTAAIWRTIDGGEAKISANNMVIKTK